ncbi:unnamed protein product [Nezara viridula]|uniref:Uncharacterized protein n=1 Tax=Nezara viridula TaxID=85310 RepID=A0A9P0H8J5_NEZVI|nr:unnamed protein product [Nezara viridula]
MRLVEIYGNQRGPRRRPGSRTDQPILDGYHLLLFIYHRGGAEPLSSESIGNSRCASIWFRDGTRAIPEEGCAPHDTT